MFLKILFFTFMGLSITGCVGLSSSPENSINPPFWKVKKGNETAYVLRMGLGLVSIKSLKCSKEIESSLKESKQLMTEMNLEKTFKAEQTGNKYFLGSIEDKKTLSKADIELLFSYLPLDVSSDKKNQFEKLNENTQKYIKEQGFYSKSKTYADYYRDIFFQFYWKVYSQLASMESELLKIANDNNLKLLVDSSKKQTPQAQTQSITVTAEVLNQLVTSEKQQNLIHKLTSKTLVSNYKNWEKAMKKYRKKQKQFGETQLSKDSQLLKNLKDGVFMALTSVAPLLDSLKKEGYKVQLLNLTTCKF